MKPLIYPLAGAMLLLAATAQDKAAQADLDKLQGIWAVASLESDGEKTPEAQVKMIRLTFAGDKLTLSHGKGDEANEYAVTIDATKKPKLIDLKTLNGTTKNEVVLGIYELNGDDLKLCTADVPKQKERPTRFNGKAGMILMTLKRAKDK